MGAGKQIKDAFIADIAPTVMAALAAAIPDSLDGHVLTDLFEPGQEPEVTYITVDDQPAAGSATELFNQEESLTVENRLRDLGYLD